MTKTKTKLAALAATFCLIVRAEVSTIEAFAALHSLIGDTNVTQSAFLDAIEDGCSDWTNQYASARQNIGDQNLREWFCELMGSSVTGCVAYAERSSWLHAKALAVGEFAPDPAVRGDTNCWLAAARDHGMLRSSIHTDAQLDEMRGAISRSVGNDGVAIIAVPDLFSEDSFSRHAQVDELSRMEDLYKEYLSSMRQSFPAFVASETFTSMTASEHNAVVSNIVAAACFSPEEATSLGLTNIVDGVVQ